MSVLPPLVDSGQRICSTGTGDSTGIDWGERPLGYYAQQVDTAQNRKLLQDLQRHSSSNVSPSRAKKKRSKKTQRDEHVLEGVDTLRPLPNPHSGEAAADVPGTSSSSATLESSMLRVQSRLHEVLDHAHRLSSQSTLKHASVETFPKELLLHRREATVPPRFLPSLRAEVDEQRLQRQSSMQAWWERSIVSVAERVSQNMPLCRAGPATQAPGHVFPGEMVDELNTVASHFAPDVSPSTPVATKIASAFAPQHALQEAPRHMTSTIGALHELLRGHPSFRSNDHPVVCCKGDGAPLKEGPRGEKELCPGTASGAAATPAEAAEQRRAQLVLGICAHRHYGASH